MDKRLKSYDWECVFGEEPSCQHNCPPLKPQPQPPAYTGSIESFKREDVETIIGMVDGENDEKDWVVYGRLKDGRYFVARGGCDYTGWDCRASNSADVAATQSDIIRFGLTEDERTRFGVII